MSLITNLLISKNNGVLFYINLTNTWFAWAWNNPSEAARSLKMI